MLLREPGAGGGKGEVKSVGCFKSNSRREHSRGSRVAKGTQQFTRDGEIQLNNYMGFRLKDIED